MQLICNIIHYFILFILITGFSTKHKSEGHFWTLLSRESLHFDVKNSLKLTSYMLTIMIFIYYFNLSGDVSPKRVSNSQGLSVFTFLACIRFSVIRRLFKGPFIHDLSPASRGWRWGEVYTCTLRIFGEDRLLVPHKLPIPYLVQLNFATL